MPFRLPGKKKTPPKKIYSAVLTYAADLATPATSTAILVSALVGAKPACLGMAEP